MNEQLLPKSFTECHERMLSLQKAGYDERFNRTITPSLIALDVLMSVWRFATNRNLLSKPKITEIENLIENALNGKFIRGAWMSIFDDVVKAEFSNSKVLKKSLQEKGFTKTQIENYTKAFKIVEKEGLLDDHLTKAFILLGHSMDYCIDAMEAEKHGKQSAFPFALEALSTSSEFIGMLHGIKDYTYTTNQKRNPVDNSIEGLRFYNELVESGWKKTAAKLETANKYSCSEKAVERWITNANKKT